MNINFGLVSRAKLLIIFTLREVVTGVMLSRATGLHFKLGCVGGLVRAFCSYQLKKNYKTVAILFPALRLVSGTDLLATAKELPTQSILGFRRVFKRQCTTGTE